MAKSTTQNKNRSLEKIFLLMFVGFLAMSCDSSFLVLSVDKKIYNGSIAVERHVWQLKKIDTLNRFGKSRPSATWYNKHDRLYYVDNSSDFPYPYVVGDDFSNFDRK